MQETMGEQERDDGISATLSWEGDLRFRCRNGRRVTEVDGDSRRAASPMEMMLDAVGSCAAVDVVEILRKGRQDLQELTVRLSGERSPEVPRRYTALTAIFHVTGDVDPDKAERAVALSFETYCSCFHSLADDIELDYRVEVEREGPGEGREGGP